MVWLFVNNCAETAQSKQTKEVDLARARAINKHCAFLFLIKTAVATVQKQITFFNNQSTPDLCSNISIGFERALSINQTNVVFTPQKCLFCQCSQK